MAGENEGFLDDLGADAATPAEGDPPAIETEHEPAAEGAQVDGGEQRPEKPNPAKSDARPDGYVPAQALREERQRANLYEQRFNQVIERFFKERAEPEQKPQADDPPDENQDPVAALAWTKRQLQQMQDTHREQLAQSEQRQQAERQWQEAIGAVQSHFIQRVAEKPELQGLYDGLRASYGREYAALNPGITPMQVAQMVERQEAQIIQWAYRNRYPIDAVIEQLAASRGVQAKAPNPDQKRDPATGQFTTSDAERAAKARESQERNASLGSAPGAPVKPMDAKELAKMPEEEMWKYLDSVSRKPGAKEFDRRMGFIS